MVTDTIAKPASDKRKKTEMVLANIYNLPAMSNIMMEVSKLLDDPSTNTNLLSKMIGKDQGLATKILSIANSPLYGLPRKVSTIDFAILIIGYLDIKNIVIALSMIESFKNKTDKNLNQNEFWLHSVISGNASKRIASDLGFKIGGEAFVAGLLHDLGIPVIHKYFHTAFDNIVKKGEGCQSMLNAEFDELGLTHQEIGHFLAKKWNLPDELGEAILFHHFPSKCESSPELASIIHVADYATQKLQIGNFYWDREYTFDKNVIDILKLGSEDKLNELIDSYTELFQQDTNNFKI